MSTAEVFWATWLGMADVIIWATVIALATGTL